MMQTQIFTGLVFNTKNELAAIIAIIKFNAHGCLRIIIILYQGFI